uniref:Cysteine rich secreted protein n=1 Tax=Riptortus pedestris TaxID=329032 RepID=R4WE42_RIPPE|nr:cysteine rich secreted protein [Riptortus pedestris]
MIFPAGFLLPLFALVAVATAGNMEKGQDCSNKMVFCPSIMKCCTGDYCCKKNLYCCITPVTGAACCVFPGGTLAVAGVRALPKPQMRLKELRKEFRES